jgi:hypothetical protein
MILGALESGRVFFPRGAEAIVMPPKRTFFNELHDMAAFIEASEFEGESGFLRPNRYSQLNSASILFS